MNLGEHPAPFHWSRDGAVTNSVEVSGRHMNRFVVVEVSCLRARAAGAMRLPATRGSSLGTRATEIVFVVEEAPEGGYTARALGEAIITEADALRAMVRDAVLCHFDEGERPRLVRLHLVRDEPLAV